MNTLFDSVVMMHGKPMPNRFMLSPLTNQQSHADGTLSDDEFKWLTMRAQGGFGLTMTCASHVQRIGQGFPGQLGCYADIHSEGLKRIADAIRATGNLSYVQLHHAGNRSPKDLIGEAPVCPSDDDATSARALTHAEVEQLIADFVAAAVRCDKAGFDGVELHGAHGYIICQFLSSEINKRTDEFGGSLENRARLLMEVTEAVVGVWGSDRVGVRLSPSGTFNSMYDSNRAAIFGYVVKELNRFNLAYLHLVAPRVEGFGTAEGQPDLGADFFRPIFNGTIITAGGYSFETGNEAIASGNADLVAYGRLYIANPDLVERFAAGAPLNKPDRNTFHGGDEKGYTDYPTMAVA